MGDIDVVIVAFSIDDPESLENVQNKWVYELQEYAPQKIPVVLVGTKCDLRDIGTKCENVNFSLELVTQERAEEVAKNIGDVLVQNVKYLECSAVTLRNLENLFAECIRATPKYLKYIEQKKCGCSLM